MGLPVWRAPSPDAKDTLKSDLSAPARSPIRRRSPYAGRRARVARSSIYPSVFDNSHFLLSAARVAAQAELDSSHLPPTRRRSHDASVPEHVIPEPSRTASLRDGDAPPSLAFDGDHSMRWRRDRYHSDIYHVVPAFGEVARSTRHLPALTPNFAPAAASRTTRPERTQDLERYSGSRRRAAIARVSARSRSPWRGDTSNILIVEDDEENSDSNVAGFPPLRRMGRRTIVDGPLPSSLGEFRSPATTLDGLGDRERSISPIEEWDTMLTTVAPDPLAPSVDSSFTSAAASASFSNSHPSSRAGSSNSNSAASSRTHLTVPSRRHTPLSESFRACDSSEDDSGSETEADDMEMPPQYRRRNRRLIEDGPPLRDRHAAPREIRDAAREATAYVRSFYRSRNGIQPPEQPSNDQLDGPTDLESQALDQELQDARAVLERLAQREDIPEHFWATFGLARHIADRVAQDPAEL